MKRYTSGCKKLTNGFLSRNAGKLALTLVFLLSSQASYAAIVTNGCVDPGSCTLTELFAGGSMEVDNLLLTEWELVSASNVNVNNVAIGEGYGYIDQFGVWSIDRELRVNGGEDLKLSYDFLVTGLYENTNILKMAGDLGYRYVYGYYYSTPVILGRVDVGTSQGASDIGSITDVFSLAQNTGRVWIDMPDGTNEVWVRTTISIDTYVSIDIAEIGYLSDLGYGPGFYYSFITLIEVGLDIRPGLYPNCFNINDKGFIKVAILGSDDFDVSKIDISSLSLACTGVAIKGNDDTFCYIEDASGDFSETLEGQPDGYDDLVCRFVDDTTVWSPENGTATLTGNLLEEFGGTPFSGTDEFCIRSE